MKLIRKAILKWLLKDGLPIPLKIGDKTITIGTNIDMGGGKISNVGAPTTAGDVLVKGTRLTMAEMPDGELGKVLIAQGIGSNPIFGDLPSLPKADLVTSITCRVPIPEATITSYLTAQTRPATNENWTLEYDFGTQSIPTVTLPPMFSSPTGYRLKYVVTMIQNLNYTVRVRILRAGVELMQRSGTIYGTVTWEMVCDGVNPAAANYTAQYIAYAPTTFQDRYLKRGDRCDANLLQTLYQLDGGGNDPIDPPMEKKIFYLPLVGTIKKEEPLEGDLNDPICVLPFNKKFDPYLRDKSFFFTVKPDIASGMGKVEFEGDQEVVDWLEKFIKSPEFETLKQKYQLKRMM